MDTRIRNLERSRHREVAAAAAAQVADRKADTSRPGVALRWALLALVPLVLVACGRDDGISRADADAILEQIDEVGSRLDAVEQRLLQLGEGAVQQPALLISEAREVSADVSEVRAMLSEVTDQLAAPAEPDPLDQPLDDPFDPFGAPGNDQLSDPFGGPLNDSLEPPLIERLGEPSVPAPETGQ